MSSDKQTFQKKLVDTGNFSLNIANGGTVSNSLDNFGTSPVGLYLPNNFTPGNLTFQASKDGSIGSFYTILDPAGAGADLTIAGVASRYVPLDPSIFAGIQYLQITCSNAQTAAVTIPVALGPLWQ